MKTVRWARRLILAHKVTHCQSRVRDSTSSPRRCPTLAVSCLISLTRGKRAGVYTGVQKPRTGVHISTRGQGVWVVVGCGSGRKGGGGGGGAGRGRKALNSRVRRRRVPRCRGRWKRSPGRSTSRVCTRARSARNTLARKGIAVVVGVVFVLVFVVGVVVVVVVALQRRVGAQRV